MILPEIMLLNLLWQQEGHHTTGMLYLRSSYQYYCHSEPIRPIWRAKYCSSQVDKIHLIQTNEHKFKICKSIVHWQIKEDTVFYCVTTSYVFIFSKTNPPLLKFLKSLNLLSWALCLWKLKWERYSFVSTASNCNLQDSDNTDKLFLTTLPMNKFYLIDNHSTSLSKGPKIISILCHFSWKILHS